MAGSPILDRTESLYRRRKIVDRLMTAAMFLAVALAVIPLFLILFYVVRNGIPGLSLDFFTQDPTRPGKAGGGVHNAIVGSGIMVAVALVIGVPIAIGTGIFLSEYGQNRTGSAVRFLIEVMAGIPSITVGLFVYSVFVLNWGYSGLAGGISLAIILIPIVARITEEMLLLVPRSLRSELRAGCTAVEDGPPNRPSHGTPGDNHRRHPWPLAGCRGSSAAALHFAWQPVLVHRYPYTNGFLAHPYLHVRDRPIRLLA